MWSYHTEAHMICSSKKNGELLCDDIMFCCMEEENSRSSTTASSTSLVNKRHIIKEPQHEDEGAMVYGYYSFLYEFLFPQDWPE
jgi:hypothetical protein